MRLKRILTSTLSVLLLTGFLITTPAEAAMGSEFANNSREYQELKRLAQSFQRGGSCYIDDYEAEGAFEYLENILYTEFDSQERFNSIMKTAYGELLYDCQTMAKQPKEKSKPKETQPEKPVTPKETQPEKPKPTKPAKPKQENNVSSKPKQSNSTPKQSNSNTTTKPKQNNNNTSSKPKSTQSTISTTKTKPNNSNTVKETQTVVATAPKETTKETVKETVVETPKETHEHGSHEDSLESLKDKEITKVQKHGDHWNVFDKDGNEYVTHEDPTHLLDKNKETQRETDKESIAETPEDDIKKEQSKSRLPLYIGGLVLVAIAAGVLIAVDSKRKKNRKR